MSARTFPARSSRRRRLARRSVVAALVLSMGLVGVMPAMGQDDAAQAVEIAPDIEVTSTNELDPHLALPNHLDGDTGLERFEYAWRTSEFSSLEAAMIANAPDRDLMPAIPEDSGEGERVVYSLSRQRVWIVAENGYLIDSYLVSGRDWMPNVGTFRVWGKARRTQGYDPSYTMNWMVRFAVGSHGGNIGFHDMPLYRGKPVQTVEELGTANLSGGCVRQDDYHARMMFAWAEIGTTVEVIP